MDQNTVFKDILPIQVRFSDVDMMGHVSNTIYQNYFDSGKIHYFDKVLPELDYVNIGVVGASVKIDYLKPIYMKTRILVKTRAALLGQKSMTIEHCLVDEHSGELLSLCTAVLVCYDLKEKKSIKIPEHWRKNILEFEDNVTVKTS